MSNTNKTTIKTSTHEIEELHNKLVEARNLGHTYIPLMGEWRASGLPYCGRKQILNKQPEWVWLQTVDLEYGEYGESDPIKFWEQFAESQPENNGYGSALAGNFIHAQVQDIIKDWPEILTIEPMIYKEFYMDGKLTFTVKGHVDILINFPSGIAIIDIKTWNHAIDRITGDNKYDMRKYLYRKNEHLDQLSIYMGIMGIKTGYLWYLNRNDGEPYFTKLQQEEAEKRFAGMMAKAAELTIHEIEQTLPDKLPDEYGRDNLKQKNWQCSNKVMQCRFFGFCFPTKLKKVGSGIRDDIDVVTDFAGALEESRRDARAGRIQDWVPMAEKLPGQTQLEEYE
ncbi:MAG: hypothetical protein IH840_00135 [Candidatus Heimdallarchaeota archaeon]|nr:hypothetical protein [Candidatus Heimdallarchaeota archaeon]